MKMNVNGAERTLSAPDMASRYGVAYSPACWSLFGQKKVVG
jgi:hypothetical protein